MKLTAPESARLTLLLDKHLNASLTPEEEVELRALSDKAQIQPRTAEDMAEDMAEETEEKTVECPECGASCKDTGGGITCGECGHKWTPGGADPEAKETTPKATFLDNAKAAIAAKATLLRENASLKAQLGERQSQISCLENEIAERTRERDAAQAEAAELAEERAQLQSALDEAQAREKTVTAATVDALASLGVPQTTLPAPDQTGGQDPRAALKEQFQAEQNPGKKHLLFRKLRDLDDAAQEQKAAQN